MVAFIFILRILEAKNEARETLLAANVLGSTHEAEGDAMRAPSEKADRWW